MASITAEQLKKLVPTIRSDRALIYAEALDGVIELAELTKPARIRHFMAQIAHESGGFRALVESTSYRDPAYLDHTFKNVQGVEHARRLIEAGPQAIGNTIYAHKLGNGGPASGDGFRFRGRGFMMVTGRSNYRELGEKIEMDLENKPELLGEPVAAAQAAAKFWVTRRINLAADRNDIDAVTLLVNGAAKLHLKERAAYLKVAEGVWPGKAA